MEVQILRGSGLFNTNQLEQEWEWARNISIVYTWVVIKMLETLSETSSGNIRHVERIRKRIQNPTNIERRQRLWWR